MIGTRRTCLHEHWTQAAGIRLVAARAAYRQADYFAAQGYHGQNRLSKVRNGQKGCREAGVSQATLFTAIVNHLKTWYN